MARDTLLRAPAPTTHELGLLKGALTLLRRPRRDRARSGQRAGQAHRREDQPRSRPPPAHGLTSFRALQGANVARTGPLLHAHATYCDQLPPLETWQESPSGGSERIGLEEAALRCDKASLRVAIFTQSVQGGRRQAHSTRLVQLQESFSRRPNFIFRKGEERSEGGGRNRSRTRVLKTSSNPLFECLNFARTSISSSGRLGLFHLGTLTLGSECLSWSLL